MWRARAESRGHGLAVHCATTQNDKQIEGLQFLRSLSKKSGSWRLRLRRRNGCCPLLGRICRWRGCYVFEDCVILDQQMVWSARGMLERAKSAENKVVKLVVDGKQTAVANQYTVLTLSFLISNETISCPRSEWATVTEEDHFPRRTWWIQTQRI